MSSSGLKRIGIISMLFDHLYVTFGTFLFLNTPLEVVIATPYTNWMRWIGRLAFPIFAFLIAEGYRQTRSTSGYAKRLALFAVISQIPYSLALENFARLTTDGIPLILCSNNLNVMVTMLLGIAAIQCWELGKISKKLWWSGTIAACVLAEWLRCDYGALGVLLIFFLWKFPSGPGPSLSVCGFSVLNYLVDWSWVARGLLNGGNFTVRRILPILEQGDRFIFGLIPVLMTCLSLPLTARYNGTKGTMKRWSCYIFYPAHLLLLTALREAAIKFAWFS